MRDTRRTVKLNGKEYPVARSNGKTGFPLWAKTRRPSQPGDPSQPMRATWRLDGPMGTSSEDLTFNGKGLLATDYNVNTDGRWSRHLLLGPALTVVDCSGNDSGDTVNDADDYALVSANSSTFLFVNRGTRPAKIDASDMTNELVNQLDGVATSIIATTAADGSIQVSFGHSAASKPYEVITNPTAAGGAADTIADNDDLEEIAVFFQADDRVIGLGGDNNPRRIAGIILTGTVDMKDDTWTSIAVVDGPEELTFTGGAMDKYLLAIGTSKGVIQLNSQFGRFFFIVPNISHDPENCRQMTTWFDPINLSVPLRSSLRRQLLGSSESWGLEVFHHNESPISGYVTGQAGSERWFWTAVYDNVEDDTYIIAWRPTLDDDLDQEHPMQPFPIIKLTDTGSRFIAYIGTADGARTNPTWVIGHNDDIAYVTAGRPTYQNHEHRDANYRFQTSGTWFGTDMWRHQKMVMDFEYIECVSKDCDADQTVTFGFSTDGGTNYTNLSGTLTHTGGATLNGVIDTAGYQRIIFVDNSSVPLATATGRTFKPRLTLATDVNTASPEMIGFLELQYRLRPEMVDVYQFRVRLGGDANTQPKTAADDLLTELGSGPVALRDVGGNNVYVRVENATAAYDNEEGIVADVVCTEWITTAQE